MDCAAGIEEGFAGTSYGRVHFIHRPGKGAKLLLLHGLGATVRTWERLMLALPLDTYAIDMLGHGDSPKPDIEYTIGAQVSAVKEFVGAECGPGPFVMGNSYGGWVAVEYALRNSAPGLIIEDGVVLDRYDEGMTGPAYLGRESKDDFLSVLLRDNGNDRHAMESIIENYTGTRREDIAALAVRTLILWGKDDDIVRVAAADALHKLIKGSDLRVLDGAGHVPHFSDTARVAAAVAGFVGGAADED